MLFCTILVSYVWRDFLLNSMSNFLVNCSFIFILLQFTQNVCKECKKELKKSCWLNNVCFQLISRLDFVCFWKSFLIILLNKERVSFPELKQITLQNLVETLHIFHKMICKSKTFFACGRSFSLIHSQIFVNQFCFTNLNPVMFQNQLKIIQPVPKLYILVWSF